MHHITHINNLESILKSGLCSRNFLQNNFFSFEDTANFDIVAKRDEKKLNDYIPFHIDYMQLKHGIPYNYVCCENNGYENMIFLSIKLNDIILQNYPLLYILYHPVSSKTKSFFDLEIFFDNYKEEEKKLNEIFKFDYSNNYVKEFRMSEILILKNKVEVDEFWSIKVFSEKTKIKVKEILKRFSKNIGYLSNPVDEKV